MTSKEIAPLRLCQQRLAAPGFSQPQQVVEWLGAMQAQDFWMARWAVGSRCTDTTWSAISKAFNDGEILRTHLMRPTWHFVSRNDIHWMLALSKPQIMTSLKYRQKQLSITPKVISKCLATVERLLETSPHVTREQIVGAWEKNNIANYDNRAAHLLVIAEMEGLICSGPIQGSEPTYALLNKRAPNTQPIDRDESIARLALRYFTSHGPATLDDFINWSNLPSKAAKIGIEAVQSKLVAETIESKKYWFPAQTKIPKRKPAAHLAAAFDEIIIGYKDRNAFVEPKLIKQVISKNGIFWPTILVNGKVTGLWKRTLTKKGMTVDFNFFRKHNAEELKAVKQAVKKFEKFLESKITTTLSKPS